jgi:hypothetical protein
MNLTDSEREEAQAIMREGVKRSAELLESFPAGTRGMMVFMATLEAMRLRYPGLFNMTDRTVAARMIVHWVAAGKPERPNTVPELLLKRFGPDAFQQIEEEYDE